MISIYFLFVHGGQWIRLSRFCFIKLKSSCHIDWEVFHFPLQVDCYRGNSQQGWEKESEAKQSEVTQSCPTFCDPMDGSLPGSSVHGILQARILEWVAISFSRGFYRPRNWIQVSCIAGKHFTTWTTRESLKRKSYTLKTIWWGFPHQIVQGLRLHPSNAEGTGSIPGWSGSSISGCIPERTEIRDSNR